MHHRVVVIRDDLGMAQTPNLLYSDDKGRDDLEQLTSESWHEFSCSPKLKHRRTKPEARAGGRVVVGAEENAGKKQQFHRILQEHQRIHRLPTVIHSIAQCPTLSLGLTECLSLQICLHYRVLIQRPLNPPVQATGTRSNLQTVIQYGNPPWHRAPAPPT